jgi:hypothetical protein
MRRHHRTRALPDRLRGPAWARVRGLLLALALALAADALGATAAPASSTPGATGPTAQDSGGPRLLLAEINGQLANGKRAKAVCLASPGPAGAASRRKEPAKFCYFNLDVTGAAWKRSDDEVFARNLQPCRWDGQNLHKWASLNGLDPWLSAEQGERVEKALRASPTRDLLQSALVHYAGPFSMSESLLTDLRSAAPPDEIGFRSEVGNLLERRLEQATHPGSATTADPSFPGTAAPVAPRSLPASAKEADRLADLLGPLERDLGRLEKLLSVSEGWSISKEVDRVAPGLAILAALAVCGLLGLVLASQALIYRLYRQLASGQPAAAPPQGAAPPGPNGGGPTPGTRPATPAGGDPEAAARDPLCIELAAYGWPADAGGEEPASGAAKLLAEIRRRMTHLARLVGSRAAGAAGTADALPSSPDARPAITVLSEIVEAVETAVSALAPQDWNEPVTHQSLRTAAESGAARVRDLANLRQELAALAQRCAAGGETAVDGTADSSRHLAAIRSRLEEFVEVRRALAGSGVGGTLTAAVSGALSLLDRARLWLLDPKLSFAGAATRLDRLGAQLEETWRVCGSPDPPLPPPGAGPERLLTEVGEGLRRGVRLAEENQHVREQLAMERRQAEAVSRAFGDYRGRDENLADTVARLVSERVGIAEQVEQFGAAVDTVLPATVLPDGADEPFWPRLRRLVGAFRSLAATHAAGQELTQALLRYLRFKPLAEAPSDGAPERLAAVLAERDAPHCDLRLGLLAALGALDRELQAAGAAGRQDVISALHLERTRRELADLQAGLEGTSRQDLWQRYLQRGFSQDWLHELLRAEALLGVYFRDQEPLAGLRDAVALASATLRQALAQFDARVFAVELLAPAPVLPAGEIEVGYGAPDDLRRIPEVKARVARHLDQPRDGLVVDLRTFLWHEGTVARGRCRVIALNPAEWWD